jgi:hypothetical protein
VSLAAARPVAGAVASRAPRSRWHRAPGRAIVNIPDRDDELYKIRTVAERANARLKDEFGARNLRVRGHAKAFCHLMFGVTVLAADALVRLFNSRPCPLAASKLTPASQNQAISEFLQEALLYTEPRLGPVVLLIAVPQVFVVPAIQRRINVEVRERSRTLLRAGDLVVDHMQRGQGSGSSVGSEIGNAFQAIYGVRLRVFKLKFGLKFLVSALQSLAVFVLLFAGGIMVLHGKTEIGIVVAFISGLERVLDPWREVIAFLRSTAAAKVQFSSTSSKTRWAGSCESSTTGLSGPMPRGPRSHRRWRCPRAGLVGLLADILHYVHAHGVYLGSDEGRGFRATLCSTVSSCRASAGRKQQRPVARSCSRGATISHEQAIAESSAPASAVEVPTLHHRHGQLTFIF